MSQSEMIGDAWAIERCDLMALLTIVTLDLFGDSVRVLRIGVRIGLG